MSSFTPRSWKSQAEPTAEAPAGKFQRHARAESNNLPIQRTAFIGRERDVGDVKEMLSRHALVTLVGAGGVGKTRLALQIGTELLEQYRDGVWFVDLARISDPELVPSVTAQALGMTQYAGQRVDEAIPLWLKRKKLLMIFDNCEHVVETVALLADAILATAQDVRIVATSRQALTIPAEGVHRLPSLSIPAEATGMKTADALRYDAVALFVDRATANDPRFALTDDTAQIVAEICRRLDGIPLAIELAAARVKVISVPHLAQRLDERFKILTGGSRTALPRQKTLSALIDWSYDLLTPPERLLFVRLGVFAGGFGLDAATNVCGGDGLDEIEILDLLGSLTDKSLVVADTSGEQERYRLLESTAAYAVEKLSAFGQRETLARRHGEYFSEQATSSDQRSGTGSTFAWLAVMERELDNYRRVLEWSLTQGHDALLGGAVAGALHWLWRSAGLTAEGRYWIGLALEAISQAEQPRVAARLQLALAYLSSGRRSYDAAERATRLYASVYDPRGSARAQRRLAFVLAQMGRLDEATAAIEPAIMTSRECGDGWNVAYCLDTQAFIARVRGDLVGGRRLFEQALAAFKALGDESGTALALSNLSELEFADGNPEQALRSASEALEIHLRGKDAENIATGHINLAAYRIAVGDHSGARESAREGMRVARLVRAELHIAVALQHLAVLAGLDKAARAARLQGYVDAQYSQLGMKREPTEQWGYDKLAATLREILSEDEIAQLAAEGAAWSEDLAVEEALQV